MAGEMLEFPHGVFGIALNLEEDSVGAVLLGDYTEIKEGDQVKRTGRIISVPGRRGDARARGERARPADRWQGADSGKGISAHRTSRPGRRRSTAGEGAAAGPD
jgi:F-type H+-transporting ATPase subunit alpha